MRRLLSLPVLLAVPAALMFSSVASAHTVTVYAGGAGKFALPLQQRYGAGINSFLINKVVINVGDTVKWDGASLAGGFHSVDIPVPHGKDLPLIIPTGAKVAGANDAAGSPFWFNGLPALSFNGVLFKALGGHSYKGSTRVDSGLPVGPVANFKVKFTTAGTFKYFCDVHPGMGGVVIVKHRGATVPTAKENAAELTSEEQKYAKEAKLTIKSAVPANEVSLGKSGPGGLELFAMFPSTLTVKAGTTVKFSMSTNSREVHTATFGPAAYVAALAKTFAGPAPAAAALYPSSPPPGPIVLTPASHGNGFGSTGALDEDSATPNPVFGAITFTTPGTYNYSCLVHPFMRGSIVVTQ
jgi:plastocyanin